MPALRALAYLTSELTYVGGAILLTPIRLLTRYHPLEKYAIGDVSLKHLRAGIGRDQINANNFRHDYPVIKVINNNDHALNNHCSALVFVSISTKCLLTACLCGGKKYRKSFTIFYIYRLQTFIKLNFKCMPTRQ